jgi:hypothetical protein
MKGWPEVIFFLVPNIQRPEFQLKNIGGGSHLKPQNKDPKTTKHKLKNTDKHM